jgi:hypothetical protein
VSQEFWKKKMTAIAQVRDMFGNVIQESTSSGVDFYHFEEEYNRAPRFSVTLNYRFNNYKDREAGRGDGAGDDF